MYFGIQVTGRAVIIQSVSALGYLQFGLLQTYLETVFVSKLLFSELLTDDIGSTEGKDVDQYT